MWAKYCTSGPDHWTHFVFVKHNIYILLHVCSATMCDFSILGQKVSEEYFCRGFPEICCGVQFFIFLKPEGHFPPKLWNEVLANDGSRFQSSNLWKLETWMSPGNLDRRTEVLPDYLFYVVAQDLYTPTYHYRKLWIMMQQRFSNSSIWTVSSWNNLKHQIWKKQCLQFKSPDFASWLPATCRCHGIPRNSTSSSSINPATARIRATNSELAADVCFVQGSWDQGISRLTTAAATLASPHVLGVSSSDLKWT